MSLSLPAISLVPYFTAGWPDRKAFVEAVCGAARAGCPAFEVGIPFTDPVADGPVIQKTSAQALEAGVDWDEALRLTSEACLRSGIPAIAMTYANPLFSRGLAASTRDLAAAGCRALIVPDLTMEEGEPFERAAGQAGLDLVYLVAPTTPDVRAQKLAERSKGFVYLVSLRGVTGGRSQLAADLSQHIERVRVSSPVPVMVGFGISSPAQAASVAAHGVGVIVGSALLQALGDAEPDRAGEVSEQFLGAMVRAMKDACHSGHPSD